MTRSSFPTTLLFAITAFVMAFSLSACNGTEVEGSRDAHLVIRVVDSAGAPLGADTVTWSYYGDGTMAHHKAAAVAHGSDSTHKPAARQNAEGTTWTVSDASLHGAVFLRATLHKPVDALCLDHGYVVREINADSLPQEVTLTVTVSRLCE